MTIVLARQALIYPISLKLLYLSLHVSHPILPRHDRHWPFAYRRKVQHALSRPGGLERFLTPEEAAAVREVLPEQATKEKKQQQKRKKKRKKRSPKIHPAPSPKDQKESPPPASPK